MLPAGRNRKFLKDPLPLEYKEIPEHGLRVILTFHPHSSFLVPLDRIVPLAVKLLGGPAAMAPDPKLDQHYKEQVGLEGRLRWFRGAQAGAKGCQFPAPGASVLVWLRTKHTHDGLLVHNMAGHAALMGKGRKGDADLTGQSLLRCCCCNS